jgi:hypothetical protein
VIWVGDSDTSKSGISSDLKPLLSSSSGYVRDGDCRARLAFAMAWSLFAVDQSPPSPTPDTMMRAAAKAAALSRQARSVFDSRPTACAGACGDPFSAQQNGKAPDHPCNRGQVRR